MSSIKAKPRRNVKTIITLTLLIVILGVGAWLYITAKPPQEITWLTDLDDSLGQASIQNKYVLIDFYAEWCPPCAKMDSYVYTNSNVIDFLSKHFICVKINIDKQPQLARKFEIKFIPTTVILNYEGEELGRIIGYRDPDTYIAEIKNILSKA